MSFDRNLYVVLHVRNFRTHDDDALGDCDSRRDSRMANGKLRTMASLQITT
jgi:hypothetical protein